MAFGNLSIRGGLKRRAATVACAFWRFRSRKFDLVSSASIDVCRFGRNIRSDPWALNLSANKKGNQCDGAKCAACHENEKSFIGRILNLPLSVARVWITHFLP